MSSGCPGSRQPPTVGATTSTSPASDQQPLPPGGASVEELEPCLSLPPRSTVQYSMETVLLFWALWAPRHLCMALSDSTYLSLFHFLSSLFILYIYIYMYILILFNSFLSCCAYFALCWSLFMFVCSLHCYVLSLTNKTTFVYLISINHFL